MFGADAFQSGGSDHGAAEVVFRVIDAGLLAWGGRAALPRGATLNGWTGCAPSPASRSRAAVFALFSLLFFVF